MPRIPETQFVVSPQAAPSVRQSFDIPSGQDVAQAVGGLGRTVANASLALSAQYDKLKVDTAVTDYLTRSSAEWNKLVENRGLAVEGKNVAYTAALDSAIEDISSKMGDRQRELFAQQVDRLRINQGERADDYVRREFTPASINATEAKIAGTVKQVTAGSQDDVSGREAIDADLEHLYELMGVDGEKGESLRVQIRQAALSPLNEAVIERKILAGNFDEAREYLKAHRSEMTEKTALRLEQQIELDGALRGRQEILDEVGKQFDGDWDAAIKHIRETYSGGVEKQLVAEAKVRQDEAARASAGARIDTRKDYHLMLEAHRKDPRKPDPNKLSITEMYDRGWSSDFVDEQIKAQQDAITNPLSAAQAIDQFNALQIEIRQTLNDPDLDQTEKANRLADFTSRAYAVQQIDNSLGSRLFTLIGQQIDRGASITELQRHILWSKDTGLLHNLSDDLIKANDPSWLPNWFSNEDNRDLGVDKEERTRISAAIIAEVERTVAAHEEWGYDQIKAFYDNFASPLQARVLLKEWVRTGSVNLRRKAFSSSDVTDPLPVIIRGGAPDVPTSLQKKASQ